MNWKALLRGRVVGDMLIDRPKIYMNLVHLRKEIADPTPVKERGWQEADQRGKSVRLEGMVVGLARPWGR